MEKIRPDDTSYKTFQDILTGYRLSMTLKASYDAGLFDVVGDNRLRAVAICRQTGWDEEKGRRFLDALSGLGLLEKDDGLYGLSLFSKQFLVEQSNDFQGRTLEFEDRLIDSWTFLNDTLEKGERVYNTENKTGEDYEKALEAYLGAMNDAAKIRARELWDHFDPGETGLILDAGAGSGAFLVEFLMRHDKWRGTFCDLGDVTAIAKKRPELSELKNRIDYVEKNLLEEVPPSQNKYSRTLFPKANIAVLSNIVHCQGTDETKVLLSNILGNVAEDGIVVIHDFFSDSGWRGALYDIHMMLNTYNGRTYTINEMAGILAEFNFLNTKQIELDSGSTVLVTSKKPISSEFIT